jgi:hypothetical protein
MNTPPSLESISALRVIHVSHEPAHNSRRAAELRAALDAHRRVERADTVTPDHLAESLGRWRPDLVLVDAELTCGQVASLLNARSVDGSPRVFVVGSVASTIAVALGDSFVESPAPTAFLEQLVIHQSKRLLIVPVAEVLWIESARSYVEIHTVKGTWLHREAISRLEKQLDPRFFVRLHRRAIVHVEALQEIELAADGSYTAVLKQGGRLRIGRRFRRHFRDHLARGSTTVRRETSRAARRTPIDE